MKNGQLKAAYNIWIDPEKQFITHLGAYQRAADIATLPSFLQDYANTYNKQAQTVVTDSGYGSEQNYQRMEDNGIDAYVKYNCFHKEQKRALRKEAFAVQNLYYNKNKDYFVCPMGQRLCCIGNKRNKSDLGYVCIVTCYQAQNCEECPLRYLCHQEITGLYRSTINSMDIKEKRVNVYSRSKGFIVGGGDA